MNFAAVVLMLFPAFMVGAAFGILLVLGLAGPDGLKTMRPIAFSLVGSLIGIAVFWITQAFWPPIVGPFILCPTLAGTAAVLGRRKP